LTNLFILKFFKNFQITLKLILAVQKFHPCLSSGIIYNNYTISFITNRNKFKYTSSRGL